MPEACVSRCARRTRRQRRKIARVACARARSNRVATPSVVELARARLVDVTPDPALARLDRADQRMLDLAIVRRRVPIRRRIAAGHVTAYQAQSQMDPRVAGLDA